MNIKSFKKNSKFLKMDMALLGPCGFCLTTNRGGIRFVGITLNLLTYLQSHKKDFGGVYYYPLKKSYVEKFKKIRRRARAGWLHGARRGLFIS